MKDDDESNRKATKAIYIGPIFHISTQGCEWYSLMLASLRDLSRRTWRSRDGGAQNLTAEKSEIGRGLSSDDRIGFLDGMRGWAAVVVVLYHVYCGGFPFSERFAVVLVALPPFNGGLAVGIFFLVSGFALSIAFQTTGSGASLVRIAAGRYVRLAVPIFVACAIMHAFLVAGIVDISALPRKFDGMFEFRPTIEHLLRASLFESFFSYSYSTSYIGPLWTIPIEFAGSFLVIAVLLAGWKRSLTWPAYASIFALFLYMESVYTLFVAGVMLCRLYCNGCFDRPVVAKLGPIAIMVGIAISMVPPLDFNFQLLFGAMLLSFGVIATPATRKLLSAPLSRRLGDWSFPIYLMHTVTLVVIGVPIMRFVQASYPGSLSAYLLATVFLVLASIGSAALLIPSNHLAIVWSRHLGRLADTAQRTLRARFWPKGAAETDACK
ncbi:acyltransferase [Kaistia dalseonensis]|uniref:Peptidoglycan/LPS O-acetylase OafA/YrhL n=1 Tax=Kaistia dalseonensis TaxID=410840 RepID=A0ABU0H221_9HYPH|nr:acyltransferase [Kaistia dalseonensis]MCX5493263.1 acyltransferase [Kaistia dalseonensis]MDQ0435820.1 peptidoglycan/LPS O-acetylase OafA/YrhL [Kaistia dalseonensis]